MIGFVFAQIQTLSLHEADVCWCIQHWKNYFIKSTTTRRYGELSIISFNGVDGQTEKKTGIFR